VLLFPGWESATEPIKPEASAVHLLLFIAVVFFAGIVKGLVGFGFSTIVTSVAVLMVDPISAVILLSVPPWVLNIYQIGETNAGFTMLKRERRLLVFSVLGSAVGVCLIGLVVGIECVVFERCERIHVLAYLLQTVRGIAIELFNEITRKVGRRHW
jgi:uncharacterized membrane protein YfcA